MKSKNKINKIHDNLLKVKTIKEMSFIFLKKEKNKKLYNMKSHGFRKMFVLKIVVFLYLSNACHKQHIYIRIACETQILIFLNIYTNEIIQVYECIHS